MRSVRGNEIHEELANIASIALDVAAYRSWPVLQPKVASTWAGLGIETGCYHDMAFRAGNCVDEIHMLDVETGRAAGKIGAGINTVRNHPIFMPSGLTRSPSSRVDSGGDISTCGIHCWKEISFVIEFTVSINRMKIQHRGAVWGAHLLCTYVEILIVVRAALTFVVASQRTRKNEKSWPETAGTVDSHVTITVSYDQHGKRFRPYQSLHVGPRVCVVYRSTRPLAFPGNVRFPWYAIAFGIVQLYHTLKSSRIRVKRCLRFCCGSSSFRARWPQSPISEFWKSERYREYNQVAEVCTPLWSNH